MVLALIGSYWAASPKDHLVTENIGNAVENAELIVCPTPAFAQLDIAELLAPHLCDGQVIFGFREFWQCAYGTRLSCSRGQVNVAFSETEPCLGKPVSVLLKTGEKSPL